MKIKIWFHLKYLLINCNFLLKEKLTFMLNEFKCRAIFTQLINFRQFSALFFNCYGFLWNFCRVWNDSHHFKFGALELNRRHYLAFNAHFVSNFIIIIIYNASHYLNEVCFFLWNKIVERYWRHLLHNLESISY